MRNPSGPEFLVLFAILITMVAAVCWRRKWNRDTSASLAPLPPPKTIDPYELAYFRAGDNELARVLILKLIETEYLQVVSPPGSFWRGTPPKRVEQNPGHPPVANLAPIELEAFEYFDFSRTATNVFSPDKTLTQVDLPTALRSHTVKYEQRLRAERLLTSDESRDAARRNAFVGIAIVVAIGVTRSFIGISLVLMAIAGIAAIAMIGRTGRLSSRGKNHLKATQDAWLSVKDRSAQGDWNPTLAASVFGFWVLAGTEMGPVNEMFVRARHSDWDGAGGGCGAAGGCGGGGCGGGCGGCGGCGGGCGGCGGG
jgi:uncharacterized protein (TIGR04222 family)